MNINQLMGASDYPQPCENKLLSTSSPSLLANLKNQRDTTAARLAKIDEAIAALEANPSVADLMQKLAAI